ncbi:hypothetical protein PPYR_01188 [Photinus pyralis]|uniref:tRNA-5-taurinomethyluridine 2-sulfurtransferase n=1 Tax=Photinus pyralis TaxID=7054 RepID=A0A1Y1MTA8_PHOPY|nr:mitochondrial tRNA-specific 2-thiouridylase 1 [Photinus pyralis]KAB0804218.1 hypothetical protein PPYR_01188 [Photinus pyralis]
MLKIRKLVIGISGGVDSAVTSLFLKNKGYNVEGVFMQNWDIRDETGVCKSDEDYKDASVICEKLGIPLLRVNFVKQYWNEVFCDLLKEYETGHTPNPDVLCNRYVKFDAFYHYAREDLNADAIATGHYARTNFGPYLEYYKPNEDVHLLKAMDERKDQTLFLCQVKQKALRKTMFPLGNYMKTEVKKIAMDNGLEEIAKKKESMGICFIGTRDFPNFISEYVNNKPGNFIDIESGVTVGTHKGIHQWTLGQRSNIEGQPIAYFTVQKDVKTNNIYVARGTHHPSLFTDLLYTAHPHWIHSRPPELENGDLLECDFKFQHVEEFIGCQVYESNKGLIVLLEKTRRAITPGQFAVFYKGEECLGSAKIIQGGPSLFTLNCGRNVSNAWRYKEKLFNNFINNNERRICTM